MKCATCQHDNPAAAKFCNGCGAALVPRCPGCAAENPPDARFCNQCGNSLGAGTSTAPSARDPRAYTPKHLADKILQSK